MPRAPGDLPPLRASRCGPAAPFRIPDDDHLPDLLSGGSANGYSGKGPLPGVPRGSLPIRVRSGIDRCGFGEPSAGVAGRAALPRSSWLSVRGGSGRLRVRNISWFLVCVNRI